MSSKTPAVSESNPCALCSAQDLLWTGRPARTSFWNTQTVVLHRYLSTASVTCRSGRYEGFSRTPDSTSTTCGACFKPQTRGLGGVSETVMNAAAAEPKPAGMHTTIAAKMRRLRRIIAAGRRVLCSIDRWKADANAAQLNGDQLERISYILTAPPAFSITAFVAPEANAWGSSSRARSRQWKSATIGA